MCISTEQAGAVLQDHVAGREARLILHHLQALVGLAHPLRRKADHGPLSVTDLRLRPQLIGCQAARAGPRRTEVIE